jgi:hypothetical protein
LLFSSAAMIEANWSWKPNNPSSSALFCAHTPWPPPTFMILADEIWLVTLLHKPFYGLSLAVVWSSKSCNWEGKKKEDHERTVCGRVPTLSFLFREWWWWWNRKGK